MKNNKKSASSSRPLPLRQSYNRERSRIGSGLSPAFTIVELIVAIVIIGILATITIIAYTGIQQKAIVATLKSDLVNSTQALKLYQVEHSAYPTAIDDCTNPTPATENMCLRSSPNNVYTSDYQAINNTNPQTFCLSAKSTNNTKYHITEDSVPELGICPFSPETAFASNPNVTSTSIHLTWDAVTDAASYTIQISTNENFATILSTTTIPSQTGVEPSIDLTNLTPMTTYYYRVNALTTDGDTSEWEVGEPVVTAPVTPDAPVVSVDDTVTDTSTWSWPDVTCSAGTTAKYQFRYTITPIGFDSNWDDPTDPSALSIYFTTSTVEDQTYTVQIQAQCYVGSNASAWSESGQASYYRQISLTTIEISGTTSVGSVLTAAATPSGATATYQWQSATTAGGTYADIPSATASTYTIVIGNVGKYIKIVATATGIYTGTQTSAASAVVSDSNWLAVGNQVWAKYNLNVGTMVTSVTTQTNNSILEKYCFDDTESNCTSGGGLYSWDEAMQYVTTEGAIGICPAGSHIPSDNDWKILEMQLGMTQAQADATGWRGTDQGTQLKSGGTSGLNMPLAGYRAGTFPVGSFYSGGTALWSSSESSTTAWNRYLSSSNAAVKRGTNAKANGNSVRCLGNSLTPIPLTGASISGTTTVGTSLSAVTTPLYANATYQWQSATTAGGTYSNIAGATASTYTLVTGDWSKYIKVVATGIGDYTGSQTSSASAIVTDPANWLAVGNQVWAKYNLNVGTMVPGVIVDENTTNQTNNSILEKYCYDNNESNCTLYGGLYQWDEAMQYVTTEGAQGICPAGSHIPSDNDWKILEMQLGMTQAQADADGPRGTDQGTQLKPGGSSGLNMPLAGYRLTTDGTFVNLSTYTRLWSSSESSPNAWERNLRSGGATVYRYTNAKGYGFSVRCLGN